MVLFGDVPDPALGILPNALLEEVGLALKGDGLHPFKGVRGLVVAGVAQGDQQPVGAELNVLLHQRRVHPDELHGEGLRHKLLLDVDGVRHDLHHALGGQPVVELGIQEAGKVAMEALVAGDELVREGKARHQAALLQPEDGAEGPGKEDPLHHAEGDAPLGEARHVWVAPLEGPTGLPLDGGDGVDGVEEADLLLVVLDVGVNQERVRFRVDVLDGNLEAVETPGLGALDLRHEVLGEVLVHDPVRCGKEGQHVTDEVPLVVAQLLPVGHVRPEIDLLRRPEGRFGLLVHLPELSKRAGGSGDVEDQRGRNNIIVLVSE
jgi:hypothetical protein